MIRSSQIDTSMTKRCMLDVTFLSRNTVDQCAVFLWSEAEQLIRLQGYTSFTFERRDVAMEPQSNLPRYYTTIMVIRSFNATKHHLW
ncbi:hypothetical protein EAE99_002831 [Botrytis elliptica]|nr:hypothetical protein EAE99_002831 [Botrytis elliptica]